jgi:hypothetical protein
MVPSTIVDAAAYVPQPQYSGSPYAGGTAPAAGYGMPSGPVPPTVGYNGPTPNPYGGPPPAYPAAPPRRAAAGSGGPSMILIGVAAFAVIGGLTTFLALRGRGGGDSDKPIPTIDVPPVATVPSDPGPGAATGADPGEPPAVEPPAVAPPPVVATHPVPKPTSTVPKSTPTSPTPTSTTKPTPSPTTPTPTSTAKPPPSPTSPGTPPPAKGPIIGPRHPIPRTR